MGDLQEDDAGNLRRSTTHLTKPVKSTAKRRSPNHYYGDMTQRDLAMELTDYLAKRLDALHPDEASAAQVLRELVKNQMLG